MRGGNSGQNSVVEGSVPRSRELLKTGTLAHAVIVRK